MKINDQNIYIGLLYTFGILFYITKIDKYKSHCLQVQFFF